MFSDHVHLYPNEAAFITHDREDVIIIYNTEPESMSSSVRTRKLCSKEDNLRVCTISYLYGEKLSRRKAKVRGRNARP